MLEIFGSKTNRPSRSFGLSERVIGLLVVGPGTPFPELIASIVAARQGNAGMVIGNVLGSNMFNVFFTLGVTALIMPVPLDLPLNRVVLANAGVTALRRPQIGRPLGAVVLASYAAYLFVSLSS